ncbi:MFS transporter [Streptacidiphilus sp. 4-A2]|nr:MFS transporter [Streptacidiphilus sp. 4-A2]
MRRAGGLRCRALPGQPAAHLGVRAAGGCSGTGEGFFKPALTALTVEITPPGELVNANALLGVGRSVAAIAGPALAGLLVAVSSPAVVIMVDAVSYGASVLALGLLRLPATGRGGGGSLLGELSAGWAEFRGRSWLVATTVQFTVINLVVWGPFLLLGPVLADQRPGGAEAWGAILAAYGAGSVAGGCSRWGAGPGGRLCWPPLPPSGTPCRARSWRCTRRCR